jgi:hypothetical protein
MFLYGCTYCQRYIGIVITLFMSNYAAGSNQEASSRNTSPTWNFVCVREVENARLEKIERMGARATLEDDLLLSARALGEQARIGRAYLATLSDVRGLVQVPNPRLAVYYYSASSLINYITGI